MTKNARPHAELIIAWANGEDIQGRQRGTKEWKDYAEPAFMADWEYRVKPARSYPVTMMSSTMLRDVFDKHAENIVPARLEDVANAAIRHAIDNGQVVPREVFTELCSERDRAVLTLMQDGYEDKGGELWRSPSRCFK